MDIQRILILLGLAVTAYLLVLAWNEDYGNDVAVPASEEVVSADAGDGALGDIPTVSPVADEVPVADELPEVEKAALQTPASEIAEPQLIKVVSDVLELEIDPLGGDIKLASLPLFPQRIDAPDLPYVLIDPRNQYAIQSGLIGPDGTDTASGRPVYQVDARSFELADDQNELMVDLYLQTETGVRVTKRFTLRRGDYLIDVEYLIDNQSEAPWSAALFGQLKRDSGLPAINEASSMGLQPFVGGATYQEGSPYTKLDFEDLDDEAYRETVIGGYMAVVQHYFLAAWVPLADQSHTYRARRLGSSGLYLFEFTSPMIAVAPGVTDVIKASVYIGPKDQYRLEEISPGLDLTVDYGFLWWLAQPLFDLLNLMHGLVKNWGVAIILLTIIVKMALYPLSAASFRSMAKMRKLQPEMVRLKERYGDDRQQFSQAMMELYKKEGANPLGGCFPILLQMPVFLALYWALLESVELRHAPFMLWINDLSSKDPFFVLPILMGVSMYVTQLLQPEPPDPMQARIFKMMPIMFTFFFLWFPSGLVLYWLVNNILSILQQWYVTRQIERKG